MSRILLPKMVAKGGGVIVNLSSLAFLSAMPQVSVYSATKVCQQPNLHLSDSVIWLMCHWFADICQVHIRWYKEGICSERHCCTGNNYNRTSFAFWRPFKNVTPGFVATAMSGITRPNFMCPSAEFYAKSAVATIGIQNDTCGCFAHALHVRGVQMRGF